MAPSVMVNAKTTRARPPWDQTNPGDPSTWASFAALARPEKVSATAGAPSTSVSDPICIERHGEHVVQDEGEPLGRSQRIEYHEQGGAYRVGQQRFALGVDGVDGIRHVSVQRLLAP